MALYDTRFGLSQSMVDYLNQGLPSIQQPYRPGYDKNYGPGKGMVYTQVEPQAGYEYVYGPDGRRYSIPIPGYDPAKKPITTMPVESKPIVDSLYPQTSGNEARDVTIRTSDQYDPYAYRQSVAKMGLGIPSGILADSSYLYPQKTGIEQLMSKIPTPFGFVKKGLDAIADSLPPNRTAIFQNELLGQGINLDNIGRISGGIMEGYNPVSGGLLNMLTGGKYGEPTQYGLEKSVEKRQSDIRGTLQDKYGLSNEQIDDVLAEIEETGTYKGPLGFNQTMGKTTNLFKNLFDVNVFNQKQLDAKKKYEKIFEQQRKEKRESDPAFIEQQKIEKAAETRRDFQQTVAEAAKKSAARKSAVAQETSNRDYARNAGRDRARDSAQSSATGRGATSATSSGLGGLGFSDKRLKENIELIGKSSSNINIYKFNYKNNPTTYQGVMADEVSWASFKHPSGYMMVDYNKIDVEFKKNIMPRSTKSLALQKIESHEKLCRIMQKQTHEKIEKLETSIDRIERILIGCAGALLVGMGGVITALIFKF